MRLLSLAILSVIAAPAATQPAKTPKAPEAANCPRTTSYYAGTGSLYHGDRITPKKLNELPPAIGYMAVYRKVNGCEAPMTMVEYRGARKR